MHDRLPHRVCQDSPAHPGVTGHISEVLTLLHTHSLVVMYRVVQLQASLVEVSMHAERYLPLVYTRLPRQLGLHLQLLVHT